jgi:hypothetical protein
MVIAWHSMEAQIKAHAPAKVGFSNDTSWELGCRGAMRTTPARTLPFYDSISTSYLELVN